MINRSLLTTVCVGASSPIGIPKDLETFLATLRKVFHASASVSWVRVQPLQHTNFFVFVACNQRICQKSWGSVKLGTWTVTVTV